MAGGNATTWREMNHDERLAMIRRHRRSAFALILLSFPIGLLVPWLFVHLIGEAQAACVSLDAGDRTALFQTWFHVAVVSGWAFLLGSLVAWRMRLVGRILVGLLLALAISLYATDRNVPLGNATDYATVTVGQCGPGGVPTWWPRFLPHH